MIANEQRIIELEAQLEEANFKLKASQTMAKYLNLQLEKAIEMFDKIDAWKKENPKTNKGQRAKGKRLPKV